MASDNSLPGGLSSSKRCQIKASVRNQNQLLPQKALTSLSRGPDKARDTGCHFAEQSFPQDQPTLWLNRICLLLFSSDCHKSGADFSPCHRNSSCARERFGLGVTPIYAALLLAPQWGSGKTVAKPRN